ncbi:LacI family DNA-binding transcriptional regulator [Actinomyces sp. MRS3W]|uniref:LacI family DNA-binding transcriptional regulator n=1 Tax=Actinomyces sp. MRS3W TaxID=2800796 RepID=UPI0028FD90FE|nr:LacI family DNA-binding transcriptional regulator [Actinomyces sp. MRS3W]MDU0348757.1 LacI family DNA-binding transcriptional regulator [Actinomyces sp. MRS3W]
MAATMRQVAELAGVSLKSVSRVVNDEPNVSQALRRKVLAAIDELGWQPNALARTLRTGRTETIAVLIPELRDRWVAALTQALVVEADRRGLTVTIEPCGGDPERVSQVLIEQRTAFDGAILVGTVHGDTPSPPPDYALPTCSIGAWADAEGSGSSDRVCLDLDRAADAVARHLRALRFKAIAVVGPPQPGQEAMTRALADAIPGAVVLDAQSCAHRAEGLRIGRALTKDRTAVDAVVCADDDLALGVLSGLLAGGVRVPEDVAVCGCGDLEDGRFSTPTLTTLRFPMSEIARAALDDLERRWEVEARSPHSTTVGPTLVRRESTLGFSSAVYIERRRSGGAL